MSRWAQDALWLGPHICDRLRAEVPELRAALVLDDLEPGANDPAQDPAAVVMLDTMRPPGSDPQQREAMAEQDWMVVLVVRSARRDGDRARQVLGPLVSRTVRALQGWTPPDSRRAFTWRPAPRPDYRKTGTYFPLMFRIQVVAT